MSRALIGAATQSTGEMRLRRAVSAIVLGLLGILAADRLLRWRAGDLQAPADGKSGTVRVRGMEVAYLESGPTDAQDVLLVHDVYIGASSWGYTELIDRLADEYHVVALDLPGFGRSDRHSVTYDAGLQTAAIEATIDERLDEPVVIAAGLGVPYALDATLTVNADRLFAISPRSRRWPPAVTLGTALTVPIVGLGLYDLLASLPMLEHHLEVQLSCQPDGLDGGFTEQAWRSAHQPGANRAIGDWLIGDLDSTLDLTDAIERCTVPVTLVGGDRAEQPSLAELRSIAADAEVPLAVFEGVGRAPHLVAPDELADLLESS